jgi:hypothetical protein
MTDQFSGYNHEVKVMTQEEWIKKHVKPGDPKNGNKPHKFISCHYGHFGREPFFPAASLKDISTDMDIGDEKGNIHVVKIIGYTVVFNGVVIASAPVYGNNGRKKTLAQQMTFCKSVVWSLKNDDGNLNEYAAKYPTVQRPDETPAIVAAPVEVPETITDIVVKTVKSFIPKYTIIEETFNPVTKSWLQVPA